MGAVDDASGRRRSYVIAVRGVGTREVIPTTSAGAIGEDLVAAMVGPDRRGN